MDSIISRRSVPLFDFLLMPQDSSLMLKSTTESFQLMFTREGV